MVVVEWLAELARDQEVLGSIPATSILFSEESAILQFVSWQRSQRENGNLSFAALLGLIVVVLGQKKASEH